MENYIHVEPFRTLWKAFEQCWNGLSNFGRTFFVTPIKDLLSITSVVAPSWMENLTLFSFCLGAGVAIWVGCTLVKWVWSLLP